MKYEILIKILDQIRTEATTKYLKKYMPDQVNSELIDYARSRAYIHLFLKVSFGLLDFDEREHYITDGSYDGGIDGYYINSENKTIYLIQSKFRTNSKNFETKEIELEEILAMDINRVLDGELHDEAGNEYSGKIKQLQREISNIDDITRYSYKVIIIANLKKIQQAFLRRLTDGYAVEIFNYEKCYEKLVFPVITGTYFNASDLNINIDLSNKNAGSKISYSVKTKISECEITVLFVPTIEIARIMNKYKNSILKYNPRSYLELDGQSIHKAIKETILQKETNEFALYNNGITMLSEETNITEKMGQKNRAKLTVKNPQIINGGQTSFTLSRIYEENIARAEEIFNEKEVLLKVITLKDNDSDEQKLQFIDEISTATNKQTPVINADKFANDVLHQKLQHIIFDRYGLLYERKRGEYADGLYNKYIDHNLIIERNLFLRIYYSANGLINKGIQKKLFQKNDLTSKILTDGVGLDRTFVGLKVFNALLDKKHPNQKTDKKIYALVYIYNQLYFDDYQKNGFANFETNIKNVKQQWGDFVKAKLITLPKKRKVKVNKITGESEIIEIERKNFNYPNLEKDVREYFSQKAQ
ncbi:MAG: AIPR family protein [Sedimentisphaerales bacterium]|nr:AIPR family protein [Sedimentisphaerales bacterium]